MMLMKNSSLYYLMKTNNLIKSDMEMDLKNEMKNDRF